MANEALDRAPLWCRQPYRPLFFTGFLLAWLGVFHWIVYAMQWSLAYRREFHALVQVQCFMTAFAIGFLFTMIPRRTRTAPPSPVQLVAALIALVATAAAAWWGRLALAQGIWLGLVATLVWFVIRRITSGRAGRRPPNAFVWLPLSFLAGSVGAVLIASFDLGWMHDTRLRQFGWLLITQVLFLGLIVGVGSMLIPLITRGESSVDGDGTVADRRERAMHGMAWLLLCVTCGVEVAGAQQAAHAARAVLILGLLVLRVRIHRLPTVPGLHRRLVWLAAWTIPLGYVVAACTPGRPQLGLHILFIGAFATMTLAVGLHVTLAHGGDDHLVRSTARPVPVFAALLLAAVLFRSMAELDTRHVLLWIGSGAASFLAATLAWGWLAVPRLLRVRET